MAKLELAADLKMTTENRFTLLKIIEDYGGIDNVALKQNYPDDWDEFSTNYANASTSGINEVFKIYEKSRDVFPMMMKAGKNSRRKAKRSAKSMKRSRVHK
jgi:hypothetical protein